MSVKFFGQFLLERGKIIKEELLDALEFQKEINVKLGTIALDASYLTAEQIEQISQEQYQSDELFGEIAVNLNYITTKQLDDLLTIQKNERITLGEALLQKGYLTLGELEEELTAFKKSQEGMNEQVLQIIKGADTAIIPENIFDITIKLFRRLVDIDVKVMESHTDADCVAPYLWNVYQPFSKDSQGVCILSVADPVFLKIASNISEEKLYEIDKLAKDAVKEFVNVIMGNSAAKLSQKGIHIDLHPPQVATSLGQIEIPPKSSKAAAVKLGAPGFELENQNFQISVVYSPIPGK